MPRNMDRSITFTTHCIIIRLEHNISISDVATPRPLKLFHFPLEQSAARRGFQGMLIPTCTIIQGPTISSGPMAAVPPPARTLLRSLTVTPIAVRSDVRDTLGKASTIPMVFIPIQPKRSAAAQPQARPLKRCPVIQVQFAVQQVLTPISSTAIMPGQLITIRPGVVQLQALLPTLFP